MHSATISRLYWSESWVFADLSTLVNGIFQIVRAFEATSAVLTPESLSGDLQLLSLQTTIIKTKVLYLISYGVLVVDVLCRISSTALHYKVFGEVPSGHMNWSSNLEKFACEYLCSIDLELQHARYIKIQAH